MNAAYDNPERPQTPSFTGGYITDYQSQPTAAYLFGADEPIKTAVPNSTSTVGFLPPKKKPKPATANRLLVFLLFVFIILSIVMIALFLWKLSESNEDNKDGNTKEPFEDKVQSTPAPECHTIPNPVAFEKLPSEIRKELDALENFIQRSLEKQSPVALTTNIVYRDRVIWEGHFGVMNNSVNPKKKPTTKTVFPVASVTKVLTTLMLYKLQDEGFVDSLDDPVTEYAPSFFVKNPFDNKDITLRQLASHRSGLQREAPCFPDTKENLCPYTNDQMLQRLRNVTLLRRPGTEPHYSNLGFALLGQALGNRFSSSYEDWIRTDMLVPLGMTDTAFQIDQSLKERIPVGYVGADEQFSPLDWGWLNPTGGAFTTVADIAKLEIALFKDGSNRYLSEEATDELFSSGYILPDGKYLIGTPWEMQILDDLLIRRKVGGVYGYSTRVLLIPEMKLAFNVFCSNSGIGLEANIDRNFTQRFLPAFKETLRKQVFKEIITPPETKQYVGKFSVEGLAPLKFIEIKMKDDKLHAFFNGGQELFTLNYTRPLNFKITIPQKLPCMRIFGLGVSDDRLVFDAPSKEDGLCDRFIMFGAHPSGWTYFNRERKTKAK